MSIAEDAKHSLILEACLNLSSVVEKFRARARSDPNWLFSKAAANREADILFYARRVARAMSNQPTEKQIAAFAKACAAERERLTIQHDGHRTIQ